MSVPVVEKMMAKKLGMEEKFDGLFKAEQAYYLGQSSMKEM